MRKAHHSTILGARSAARGSRATKRGLPGCAKRITPHPRARAARPGDLVRRKEVCQDAQSASFHHPRARAARPGDPVPRVRATGQGIGMCEECEEIEPLTVAYFGKADRKGWRPPAAAKSAPVIRQRHERRLWTIGRVGRPYAIPAPRLRGVPEGPQEVAANPCDPPCRNRRPSAARSLRILRTWPIPCPVARHPWHGIPGFALRRPGMVE